MAVLRAGELRHKEDTRCEPRRRSFIGSRCSRPPDRKRVDRCVRGHV